MYKLIAMDMDDTLLDDQTKISIQNKEAIKRAEERGIRTVLCSGRSLNAIKIYLDELKEYGCNDYYIAYNGAVIMDSTKEAYHSYNPVPRDIAEELIEYGRSAKISVNVYNTSSLIVENYSQFTRWYEENTKLKAIVVEDLKEYVHNGSIKILFNAAHEDLIKIKEELEPIYAGRLEIFFSKLDYLEFVTTNKGRAVMDLAESLGIHPSEVIAIGDSYNDIPMLQMAGLGCAVQNAQQVAKDIADYISVNDNNNHAVAEIINKFCLD